MEREELGLREEDEDRSAANLACLKSYYEYLIQQYPYSKQHSGSVDSALDFHVALYSAEMEAAHAAHKRGLEKLHLNDDWAEDGDDDAMDLDKPMEYGEDGRALTPEQEEHLQGLSRHELRLRERENELRLAALGRMKDLTERMDTTMETAPFSRDHELLRLRAMVALYTGDLSVPPAPRSETEDKEGKRARARQRGQAKGFLERIKDGGGQLKDDDEGLLEFLESDDQEDEEDEEDDGPSVLPMFSSMG
ncbi:hypothetical protein N0V88_003151 [Collariella sp. IMI 366227]|nr:hypothetical protein N0V88_003151 [Collariella sp. IMI 366227]